jgi:hypothetical protein
VSLFRQIYFAARPFMPARFRIALRRRLARRRIQANSGLWPINESAGKTPAEWPGWPEGRQFAVVLTHDVESPIGYRQVRALADLEQTLGFRSSFNFVPEGSYRVEPGLREELTQKGFEVGVHDLNHDGKLYHARRRFRQRAARINHYLRDWNCAGFRSAFMLHRLDWLHELEMEYDASTFDTDPFELQPEGVTTIFPFWVTAPSGPDTAGDARDRFVSSVRGPQTTLTPPPRSRGFIELPYTLVQDISLFIILNEDTTRIWEKKLDWIAERGGMALLNVHPDYMGFSRSGYRAGCFAPSLYGGFLQHLKKRYGDAFWHALPREVSRYTTSAYKGSGPRRPGEVCAFPADPATKYDPLRKFSPAMVARSAADAGIEGRPRTSCCQVELLASSPKN